MFVPHLPLVTSLELEEPFPSITLFPGLRVLQWSLRSRYESRFIRRGMTRNSAKYAFEGEISETITEDHELLEQLPLLTTLTLRTFWRSPSNLEFLYSLW